MSIRLSIGTAIYNLEEGMLRANIEGVMKQLTDETELLLIDDCSTNNSGSVCREYAEKDSRIRYINMGTNGGLSRVRNRTVDEAAGEWIFFADGDDLLSEHFIETALRFLDAQYDIIIHDRLKFIDTIENDVPCTVGKLTELPRETGRELGISCLCLDPHIGEKFGLPSTAFYHAAWGAFYRKDFLTGNSLTFPEGQKKAQDSVFNTKAYFRAEKIAYLPYVMYYYRTNAGGITRRYSADLPEVSESLIGHLRSCLDTLYANDPEVETLFEQHRILSLVVDNMRLHSFHKDNPNDKEYRRKGFLEFIETEPYKSAIDAFDPKLSGRWEWHLPVSLIKKKKFDALDKFVGDDKKFNKYCGIDKRLAKLFR